MTDLSNLSDDELLAMREKVASAPRFAAPAEPQDLTSLSDDDLLALREQAASRPAAKPSPARNAWNAVGDFLVSTSEHAPMIDLVHKIGARSYAAQQKFADLFRDEKDQHNFDDYVGEALKGDQKLRTETAERSPTAWKAGSVVGPAAGLAYPMPGSGMKGLAGAATRIASTTGLGGLDIGSKGLDDPDLIDVDKAKQGATLSGLISAGVEAGAPILSKVGGAAANSLKGFLGGAADKLDEVAAARAAKASLGQTKTAQQISEQGRLGEVGKEALDAGVLSAGDKAKDIVPKALAAKRQAGKKIRDLIEQVDAASPNLFDGKALAQKIREYTSKMSGQGNKTAADRLNEIADAYENMGPMSLGKALQEKKSFKYRFGDSLTAEANNTVRGLIGDEIENAVGRHVAASEAKAASQFGQPLSTGSGPVSVLPVEGQPVLQEASAPAQTLLEDYLGLNRRYGAMAAIEKGAKTVAGRQAKNATFGLLPTITGAAASLPAGIAAVAHGNPIMAGVSALAGLAGAGATKLVRERGSSAFAVSADRLADVLRSSPESFGRYAGALTEAAKRGSQSLAATNFVLQQTDPGYRQKHKELFESGDSGAAP